MNEKYIHKSDLDNVIELWTKERDEKMKLAKTLPDGSRRDVLKIRIKELDIRINELKLAFANKAKDEEAIAEKLGYKLLLTKGIVFERYKIKSDKESEFGFELYIDEAESRRGDIVYEVKIRMVKQLNAIPNLEKMNNELLELQDIARYFGAMIYVNKKTVNR